MHLGRFIAGTAFLASCTAAMTLSPVAGTAVVLAGGMALAGRAFGNVLVKEQPKIELPQQLAIKEMREKRQASLPADVVPVSGLGCSGQSQYLIKTDETLSVNGVLARYYVLKSPTFCGTHDATSVADFAFTRPFTASETPCLVLSGLRAGINSYCASLLVTQAPTTQPTTAATTQPTTPSPTTQPPTAVPTTPSPPLPEHLIETPGKGCNGNSQYLIKSNTTVSVLGTDVRYFVPKQNDAFCELKNATGSEADFIYTGVDTLCPANNNQVPNNLRASVEAYCNPQPITSPQPTPVATTLATREATPSDKPYTDPTDGTTEYYDTYSTPQAASEIPTSAKDDSDDVSAGVGAGLGLGIAGAGATVAGLAIALACKKKQQEELKVVPRMQYHAGVAEIV